MQKAKRGQGTKFKWQKAQVQEGIGEKVLWNSKALQNITTTDLQLGAIEGEHDKCPRIGLCASL